MIFIYLTNIQLTFDAMFVIVNEEQKLSKDFIISFKQNQFQLFYDLFAFWKNYFEFFTTSFNVNHVWFLKKVWTPFEFLTSSWPPRNLEKHLLPPPPLDFQHVHIYWLQYPLLHGASSVIMHTSWKSRGGGGQMFFQNPGGYDVVKN